MLSVALQTRWVSTSVSLSQTQASVPQVMTVSSLSLTHSVHQKPFKQLTTYWQQPVHSLQLLELLEPQPQPQQQPQQLEPQAQPQPPLVLRVLQEQLGHQVA